MYFASILWGIISFMDCNMLQERPCLLAESPLVHSHTLRYADQIGDLEH